MSEKRKPGFYFCRSASLNGHWTIGYYNGVSWHLPEVGIRFNGESTFDEIDERRIVRDETKNEDK